MSVVHLAVIGCGAVTELWHLPAAELAPEVKIVALADKDLARAERLGERYGISTCTADYRQLPEGVDGVIVALPNVLHAPATIEFLGKGIPVLVEKPMALTVQEAEAMVQTAEANGVALQVGLMFRFCQGARLMKRAIHEGWLGPLRSFSLERGLVYEWPVASGFPFSRTQAGGGELIDCGSHWLDLLLWWLGDAVDLEYRDDNLGGVEADCELSLTLRSPTGLVDGTVIMSRLRKLGNVAQVIGERFTIEYELLSPARVCLWPTARDRQALSFTADWGPSSSQTWNEVYAEQLRAFAQAITTGDTSAVPGKSVLRSVDLIERCYRERQPLELPWMPEGIPSPCGTVEP